MVYDVENLFTVRPERASIGQAQRKKPVAGNQSFVDFTTDTQATSSSQKSTQQSIRAASPFDVDGAFKRLGEILANNTRNQLEQSYSGRGSILNLVA